MRFTKTMTALMAVALFAGCQSAKKKEEAQKVEQQQQAQAQAAQAQQAEQTAKAQQDAANKAEIAKVNAAVASWPSGPKLAVQQMISKYGPPAESSANRVAWKNAGPFKRIEVFSEEIPHDFPSPHTEFIRHTISYDMPIDKADEVTAFNSSATFDKTAGELSTRGDSEEHNILALNLAKRLVEGQGTIQDARREYATNIVAEMMGKPSILLVRLNFEPQANAGYRDLATIPGSSVRPSSPDTAKGTDAEVLAYMNAIDDTDIKAAATALKKDVRPEVKEYAKLIQKEHGDSKVKTMRLSSKIAVAPVETSSVGAMNSKNTDELAALVPLDGAQFEQGFAAEMVKNHEEALALIDNQLMNEAEDPQVRQNLAEARGHISYHLELAKKLQQP